MACSQGVPSGFCSPRPCIAHGGRCLTLWCRKDKARREKTSNQSCSKLFSDRAPSEATQAFPIRTTCNRQPKRKTNLTSRESKGPQSGPPPSSPCSNPSSGKASTHGQPRQWPADSSPANSEQRSHLPRTCHGASPARERGLPETSSPGERLGHGHGASSGFTGFAPYLPTP